MRIVHEGRLVLHIVPFSVFSQTHMVTPRQIHECKNNFATIGQHSGPSKFNFDGCITYLAGDQCYGYTQVFTHGNI